MLLLILGAAMLADTSVDWPQIIGQGGPWAVFVLLIVLGKVVPGTLHDRLYADYKAQAAVIESMAPLLRDLSSELTRVTASLAELAKEREA